LLAGEEAGAALARDEAERRIGDARHRSETEVERAHPVILARLSRPTRPTLRGTPRTANATTMTAHAMATGNVASATRGEHGDGIAHADRVADAMRGHVEPVVHERALDHGADALGVARVGERARQQSVQVG